MCPPDDHAVVPGPASLLVHRHDERLNHMQNALVRGESTRTEDGWLLVPGRVLEPMGLGTADRLDTGPAPHPAGHGPVSAPPRYATAVVEWDRFRALERSARRSGPA
ncbi:hypothetical protein ACFYXF_28725 [Streptomyces sp. NPDC002680]|uniref:hypothetical protein n=1 Tax=Streptomyces sp. NPDC002680 TaxID=3364659 RepID=UPI0036AF3F30